jgi:enterochelin esterase-like enzyme
LVEQGARDGTLPPMILVLARLPEPVFSGTDGGPGSYEVEFLDGLVASIDRAFRTEADAEGRALLGISRGGVWALEIGLRNPTQVSAVVALSPALAVNHARPAYDPLLLAATAPAIPARLLLATGDEDWARPDTEEIAARFEQRGAELGLIIAPGNHSDALWRSLLPSVLDFLAAAFPKE